MQPDAGRAAQHTVRPADLVVVCVQPTVCGRWEVMLPDRCGGVKCDTFEEARRIAYPAVAHARPCELIVHDAYHRVVDHERIDSGRTQIHRGETGLLDQRRADKCKRCLWRSITTWRARMF